MTPTKQLKRGDFAQDVWRVICESFGILFTDIPLRQLLINWWRQKTPNPVSSIIVKCLPALTIWEIWKSRCDAKYGSQKMIMNKSISQIAFNISQLVNHFLGSKKMKSSWEEVLKIISSTVYFKNSIFIKWTKPLSSFVKLNIDGSCRNGNCGGGGIVRDHEGNLIIAFSLRLGEGTSNWAEAVTLLFGMSWCKINGYENVRAESDSKLLVDCVNKKSSAPWTMANEVQKLQKLMNQGDYSISHCYREINQVANKLATLSHNFSTNMLYSNNEELNPQIKRLVAIDKLSLPVMRVCNRRKRDFTFDPP